MLRNPAARPVFPLWANTCRRGNGCKQSQITVMAKPGIVIAITINFSVDIGAARHRQNWDCARGSQRGAKIFERVKNLTVKVHFQSHLLLNCISGSIHTNTNSGQKKKTDKANVLWICKWTFLTLDARVEKFKNAVYVALLLRPLRNFPFKCWRHSTSFVMCLLYITFSTGSRSHSDYSFNSFERPCTCFFNSSDFLFCPFCPSHICLLKKTVHIIIMYFYQLRGRWIVLTLKVVKHAHELIGEELGC